ncbi:helix-turn-helix domain-containing protein [Pseudomonas sp. NPDC089741]
MERSQHNASETARLLRLTRPALAYRLKKHPRNPPLPLIDRLRNLRNRQ